MPRPNVTQFAVLGMLGLRPRTGYDIKQFAERAIGHFWHESYRWIYTTLADLEAGGLVTSRADDRGQRQRVVYRITKKGERALRQWLAESASPPRPRDELLLKLLLSPPRAGAPHVQRHLEHLRQRLAQIQEARRAIPSMDLDAAARQQLALTLDHSRRVAAAEVRWAEEALRTLKAPAARRRATLRRQR